MIKDKIFDYDLDVLLDEAKKIRFANFGSRVCLRLAHNYLTKRKCTSDCAFCTWSRNSTLDYAEKEGLVVGRNGNSGIDEDSCSKSTEIAFSLGAGIELTSNIERMDNENLLRSLCEIIEKISKRRKLAFSPELFANAINDTSSF